MYVWNVLHAARWKYRMQKWRRKSPSGHYRTTLQPRHTSTIGKKLVKQQYLLHMCSQYGELWGPLAAEIVSLVWGTPANFNGFCILAALLHRTLVVGVSQTCGVEQRAPPILGRAAITFGIGPHSSWFVFYWFILNICHLILINLWQPVFVVNL